MLETKEFSFEGKADENGVIEGYASTFGNVDLVGDIVLPGAFSKSIKSHGGVIPVLWQHDRHSPIGVGMEMAEDERGLKIKAQLAVATSQGRDAYELLKLGAIKGLSIGYSIPANGYDLIDGVRNLKAVNVHEYSLVTYPANPKAKVTRVKAEEMTERDLEKVLRDAGLSRNEAKALLSGGFHALKSTRDAMDPEKVLADIAAIYRG